MCTHKQTDFCSGKANFYIKSKKATLIQSLKYKCMNNVYSNSEINSCRLTASVHACTIYIHTRFKHVKINFVHNFMHATKNYPDSPKNFVNPSNFSFWNLNEQTHKRGQENKLIHSVKILKHTDLTVKKLEYLSLLEHKVIKIRCASVRSVLKSTSEKTL